MAKNTFFYAIFRGFKLASLFQSTVFKGFTRGGESKKEPRPGGSDRGRLEAQTFKLRGTWGNRV